ncbi:MAG TPA: tyrosine-protein phosphatase [Acidobacteriaceae bacterium]
MPVSSRNQQQLSEAEGHVLLPRREFLKRSLQCALLPSLASPWLISCGGSSTVAPTPRLASVNNFRDVAGADDATAYRTAGGQKLRRGVIYRSCALAAPSAAALATMEALDILTIVDLRTPGEIQANPDHPPSGATETNINVNGTPNAVNPPLSTPAEAIAYMESSYEAFVTDSGIRGRIAEVLHLLAHTPGCHLYHCSGGKDRTGWITNTLLNIVGVPQSVINQDYLLTNVYAQATIDATYKATAAAYGQSAANIIYPVLVADQRYLDAALAQVTVQYGTMASYVSNGLGLDAGTLSRLSAMLLSWG